MFLAFLETVDLRSTASLNGPAGVAVDSKGDIYIADTFNERIRKVSDGIITTVVGDENSDFSGDGGPATRASINLDGYSVSGLAVDSADNLYIADYFNVRIRKVSDGIITTVAGNGDLGYFSGEGGRQLTRL